jgi:RNA-directed DNA polymerase
VTEWCRKNRHKSVRAQHAHLSVVMRGHYAYYGVSGNYRRLSWCAMAVARIWRKWLSRRDRQGTMSWRRFAELLRRYPLPAARIVHCYTGTLL